MEGVQHLKIPLKEIMLATNNFGDENIIGLGAFGKVYLAELSLSGQRKPVAIKRLHRTITYGQGKHEFMMEIQMLSCYRHKNLISLFGFCDENGEMILVYEHAKNGSLDRYLSSTQLSWMQRLQISIGTAHGLNYLHNGVGPKHRVLHRDIKSSNILLNENWEAKISDFGLSRIGPSNVDFTFLITSACGTVGYVDPQYGRTGILTKESDVYSFGVVLIEILCGRLVHGKNQDDQNLFLSSLAQKYYEQNRLAEIIHPNLKTQMKADSLDMFSMVAYQCLKEKRIERPTMAWIVEKLEKALQLQTGSTVPRYIRVGTWERQISGPDNKSWSFELEQDHHLSKIVIDHGDAIYSLIFTSEANGGLHTSNKVGGLASEGTISEVLFDGDEEITSISGSVGTRNGYTVISSLALETTKRTHGPFGQATDNVFSLPWDKGSFSGFYGLAGNYIESIGVSIKPLEEIVKVGTWGRTLPGGPVYAFQLLKNHHLKKITIEHGEQIYSLMFTSEYRGSLYTYNRAGGSNGGDIDDEVTLDWDEEIHAIHGWVGLSREEVPDLTVITSISFVTSKKIHGPFGHARGMPFTVTWNDCSFMGFYGIAGFYIDSIGVYLSATT